MLHNPKLNLNMTLKVYVERALPNRLEFIFKSRINDLPDLLEVRLSGPHELAVESGISISEVRIINDYDLLHVSTFEYMLAEMTIALEARLRHLYLNRREPIHYAIDNQRTEDLGVVASTMNYELEKEILKTGSLLNSDSKKENTNE